MQKQAHSLLKKILLLAFLFSYEAQAAYKCFTVLFSFPARIISNLQLAHRNRMVGNATIGIFGRLKEKGIQTNRLTLKALERKDFNAAFDAILAGKDTFFLESKNPEEKADQIIYELAGKGRVDREGFFDTSFAIYDNETQKFVGFVSLTYRIQDQSYGMPYLISPEYQNKGYATEALTALLDNFRDYSDKSIPLIVKPMVGNTASRRVFEKLGFVHSHDEEAKSGNQFNYARPAQSVYEFPQ